MGLDISFYKRKFKKNGTAKDVEVGYFRKVNFLLPFFGYEDNMEDLQIDKCLVEYLVSECNEVLAYAKDNTDFDEFAEEHLPTQSGFFFGSTDYDEDYLADVKHVKESFETILSDIDWDKEELIMNCWW